MRRLVLVLSFGVTVLVFALAIVSLVYDRMEFFALMLSHLGVGVGGWSIGQNVKERQLRRELARRERTRPADES